MGRLRLYLYDGIPVKMERTAEGTLRVDAFDPELGIFCPDMSYRTLIMYDRDNLVREVGKSEFEKAVMRLGGTP